MKKIVAARRSTADSAPATAPATTPVLASAVAIWSLSCCVGSAKLEALVTDWEDGDEGGGGEVGGGGDGGGWGGGGGDAGGEGGDSGGGGQEGTAGCAAGHELWTPPLL